jgi:hypothetical protein
VQAKATGQVVLKLKAPWCDGTTHLVMSTLACMQRLAALVPRPRLHLEAPVIGKILTHPITRKRPSVTSPK